MCRESPFPRCDSHAKAKMERKHAIMQKASEEYTSVKAEELNKQHYLDRDHNSVDNHPEVVKALHRSQKAQKEYTEAVAENNITLSSLKNLKDQIIDIRTHLQNPGLKPTVQSYDYSEDGAKKLEALYQERLSVRKERIKSYDAIHNTVNGRKPSKYGTSSGVKDLKKAQAKAFDNWMTALEQNRSPDEVSKKAIQVDKAEKAYRHAVATLLHKRNQSSKSTNPTLEGEK